MVAETNKNYQKNPDFEVCHATSNFYNKIIFFKKTLNWRTFFSNFGKYIFLIYILIIIKNYV
jgi:hypothetical protein